MGNGCDESLAAAIAMEASMTETRQIPEHRFCALPPAVPIHFCLTVHPMGLKDPSFLFWKADTEVAIDLSLTG